MEISGFLKWAQEVLVYQQSLVHGLRLLFSSSTLRFKSAYGTEFFSKFEFPDFKILHEILRGGIPVGLGNFIELSMFSGAGIILGRFGSEVIAANGIALTIGGLFFMVPLSIGNAAAVRVGNNVGAKNLKGAKYSSYFSLRLSTVCALINGPYNNFKC